MPRGFIELIFLLENFAEEAVRDGIPRVVFQFGTEFFLGAIYLGALGAYKSLTGNPSNSW